jgi:hypothetical protein
MYDQRFLLLRLISICVSSFLEPRSHAERVYADAKLVRGIKPSCDVRNPSTQTIKLLTYCDFRASSIVTTMVRKQEK